MSVHRNRQVSTCEKCHGARASVFGRWCDRCWAELTHEEQLLAAEQAAEDGFTPRMAPPRLARPHERRNGHGVHVVVAGAEDMRAMRARGYVPTTLRTPLGGVVYRKDEAR